MTGERVRGDMHLPPGVDIGPGFLLEETRFGDAQEPGGEEFAFG